MESNVRQESIDDLEKEIAKLNIKSQQTQNEIKVHDKVAYVFDVRMLLHKTHDEYHVERPERTMSIYMNLVNKELTEKLTQIPSSEISEEDILRVHTKELLEKVKATQYCTENRTEKNPRIKNEHAFTYSSDCYDNHATYESSLLSAGSLLNCCKAVMEKKVNKAFAIIRPPGHHANKNNCAGFCFFNNVAIAAKYLIDVHKLKVAIVDWDVHHGDGTQDIFEEDNNPLFISIHRFDNGFMYPGKSGTSKNIGKNQGKGYNINIPWNFVSGHDKTSIGDSEYFYAFKHMVIPVLKEFKPDIILVSSGFDAAENDPLGGLNLSPIGYSYMTKQLMGVCDKLVVALEGGYNLDSLARCSEAIIRTLLGEVSPFKNLLLNKNIDNLNLTLNDLNEDFFIGSNDALKQLQNVQKQFIEFWPSLKNNLIEIKNKNKQLRKNDIPDVLKTVLGNGNEFLLNSNDLKHSHIRVRLCNLQSILGSTLATNNKAKHIKNIILNSKTTSKDIDFRIEGMKLTEELTNDSNVNEKLNWNKRDKMFDIFAENIRGGYILYFANYIEKAKVSKESIIDSLRKLNLFLKEKLSGYKYDINNVDLYIIVEKKDLSSGVTTRSKSKTIGNNTKIEVNMKLNGIKKNYIIKKKDDKDENKLIFAIEKLTKDLDENLM